MAEKGNPAGSSMPKTVLIVEDVADVRMMMKILVQSYGYKAVTADDGYEAIEKFKKYHPDLVLMDMMMPILDGVIATKVIRNLDEIGAANIPIIALTAYKDMYGNKAIEAGCDIVIPKPLDFDNFKPLLHQYLD